MNILFPTDFSENSKVALKYAADLVKNMNANLKVFHVYEVPKMEDVSNLSGAGEILQDKVASDVVQLAEKRLKEFVTSCGLNHEHYDCEAINGSVRIQIDRLLSESNYDLVIMATHNENSKKGLFFGGIAQHLLETANCPVFAIPPNAEYSEIKSIMYPTDLVHDEKEALNWLINFARPTKAIIELVNIGDDNDDSRRQLLDDLVIDLPYDHLSFDIVPGTEVSKVIVELAESKNADMIAMTTFTTSFFNKIFHASNTKDVLDNINIPFIGFSKNTKL